MKWTEELDVPAASCPRVKTAQQGSVTIIMAAILGVVAFILVALASIGSAYDSKSRTQAVTDIAALYAAELVWNQQATASFACDEAIRYARTQKVEIHKCHKQDQTILLSSTGQVTWGIAQFSAFTVSARAGPVNPG